MKGKLNILYSILFFIFAIIFIFLINTKRQIVYAASICGNNIIEEAEQCDDGNLINGDGCNAGCQYENVINVQDYGAIVNDELDDTSAFQDAIDYLASHGGGILTVGPGIYKVDAAISVNLKSNIIINFEENAQVEIYPNGEDNYTIFKIWNVENVKINGGIFVGDRDDHTGITEWGMGFSIKGSKHIVFNHVYIKDCWGDGIYIGTSYLGSCEDIHILNSTVDNNRRQGLSLISGKDIYIENFIAKNTRGTSPQAGIDIEPNYSTELLENINIKNCHFENNSGHGLLIQLLKLDNTSEHISILVDEIVDNGSKVGVSILNSYKGLTGNVLLKNLELRNNKLTGVRIMDWTSTANLTFQNIKVINPNRRSLTEGDVFAQYAGAFYIGGIRDLRQDKIGNISFINPEIIVEAGLNYPTYNFYIKDELDCEAESCDSRGIENVNIINPISLTTGNIDNWLIYNPDDLVFSDDNNQLNLYDLNIAGYTEEHSKNGQYPVETTIKLNAPSEKYGLTFYRWGGDNNNIQNVNSPKTILTMPNNDINIVALYGENCGNFQVNQNEQCDDGNLVDGDGCSSSCQNEINADVNNSGTINIFDANLTFQKALGLDMSGTGWINNTNTGDANCNNSTNIFDANLIFKHSLELDVSGEGWCVN